MTWLTSLLLCATCIAIAVALLGSRDKRRSRKLVTQLRNQLAHRERCSDAELASVFPIQREKEIAVKFRERLSKALGIESETIHAQDDLHRDFHLDAISPFLIGAIASEFTVDPRKQGSQQVVSFQRDRTKFTDFVRAISQQSS